MRLFAIEVVVTVEGVVTDAVLDSHPTVFTADMKTTMLDKPID